MRGAVLPDPTPTPDAQPAAPSAAASPDAGPLDTLQGADLIAYRMTGKIPEPQAATTPADSSPATPETAPAASTEATSEPASEPAKKGAEARIPELLAERAKERERAERAERRLADIERQQQSRQTPPAAPSPAPTALVKPDPEKFPYGTADPGYLEALADYKVDVRLASERAAWETHQRTLQAHAESQRVLTAFEAKAEAARAKHPDFDDVALKTQTSIQPGSLADLWVMEDEAGAEVLYHLQQNPAEQKRILKLPYREQVKELVRLGDRLTSAETAARSTTAPPPPPALRTRATPADPVERALADGTSDEATRAYIDAMNKRDLARRR